MKTIRLLSLMMAITVAMANAARGMKRLFLLVVAVAIPFGTAPAKDFKAHSNVLNTRKVCVTDQGWCGRYTVIAISTTVYCRCDNRHLFGQEALKAGLSHLVPNVD